MRAGFLDELDWDRLRAAAIELTESSILVDDTPMTTIRHVYEKTQAVHEEKALELVVVDDLQRLAPLETHHSKAETLARACHALHLLGRELRAPILALSQLNREPEKRRDHRPILSDLRDSGVLEEFADVVFFLYRDEAYHPDTTDRGVAEVIVSKHRNGPLGMRRVRFRHETVHFEDLREE